MAFDVDNIICVKQLLNNSINDVNFDYIKKLLNKTVEDCNLLYTQVCYLIKLFLLHDYEINKNKFNDYTFNEKFINNCFRLIKTDKINDIELSDDNDTLIYRVFKFYNQYNSDNNGKIKFIKPDNVSSITNITKELSRDIQTNITNNIILNFNKYLKEYVSINLKLSFNNIDDKIIYDVFRDIGSNTFYSDLKYHSWIINHKKLVIPLINNTIYVKNFEKAVDEHCKLLYDFTFKYIKKNKKLLDLIVINNDKKKVITDVIINYMFNKIDDNIDVHLSKYIDWIDKNKISIINDFNSLGCIDLDKKIDNNPYNFIPSMLFMNKNLESNNSKKKYQIIPLRTNLTPKFIPIGINSLVDILDSKYLFGKIKNYYHDDYKHGFILFETYFKFDSKYIKRIIKKGYVFSGLIYTNGYEINYIFNSKTYNSEKDNFHSKANENRKNINKQITGMDDKQKEEYIKKYKENKEKEKNEKLKSHGEKEKLKKQDKKDELKKTLKQIEADATKLKNDYNKNLLEIEDKYYKNLKLELDPIDKTKKESKKLMNDILNKLNDIYITDCVYLKHVYDRNHLSLVEDFNNDIDTKYNNIKNKETTNNKLIVELKKKINETKNKLKKIKKEKFNSINKKYKNDIKLINKPLNEKNNNKITLNRLINKIRSKLNMLDYDTNNTYTFNHVLMIEENLISLILKINNMKISNSLNDYLNQLGPIENIIYSSPVKMIKQIINTCLKCVSVDVVSNNEKIDLVKVKLMKIRLKK